MAFLILCVDKENPAESELVPVDPPEGIEVPEDEAVDAQIFPTKENAIRWTKEDEKEFPGIYDYHIIQVG